MNFDSIIFDLDGTLWDSAEGICGTWQEILKNHKELNNIKITVDSLHSCMGLPLDEIGKKLLPGVSAEMQKKLMKECCDYENIYLSEHGGVLFPKLEETLEYLSEKYKLFIVSNCQEGYIESFFTYHKTDRFFTDIECNGATGLSKGENNKLIIKRNNLKNAVYVGDTAGDLKSARDAGIPFIYAEYGFGEVSDYDYVIRNFSDLSELL